MMSVQQNTALRSRVLEAAAGLMCSLLCIALLVAAPTRAFAYVSNNDIVAGQPMSERDLTVAQQIDIDAPFACMIDSNGLIYFERGAHEPLKIASMTKIMTAILALENSSPTDILTVSYRAATVGESSANLREGDQMTMFNMLCCLLIPSGNDAATAIAEFIGEKALALGWDLGLEEGEEPPTDPFDAFVCLMNKKGRELELEDSVFTNPHGLDDGVWYSDMHSTPYDVCLIARYAMQFDDFRRIVCSTGATVDVVRGGETRQLSLTTTDWFLASYAYATGVKTGSTDYAGYCFVGSSKYLDLELYAVVLQCDDENSRFIDVQNMHVWGFLHRVEYNPVNSDETVTVADKSGSHEELLFAEVAHPGWIDRTFKTYLENPDEILVLFDIDGNITQRIQWASLDGNIKKGQVVGTVEFLQHNRVVCTKNIIAAEDCPAPDMFQSVRIWVDRMKLSFQGKDSVALTRIANTLPRIVDKTTA